MIVWRVGRKRGAIPEQFLCITGEKGTGWAGLCTRADKGVEGWVWEVSFYSILQNRCVLYNILYKYMYVGSIHLRILRIREIKTHISRKKHVPSEDYEGL